MQQILERHKRLSQINSLCILLLSGTVLFAYQFNELALKNLFLGKQLSNPITAICFILSAISLYGVTNENRKMQNAGQLVALLVLATGLIRFTESFTPYVTGIDRWLYTNKLSLYGNLGKANYMAPNTAFLFFLSGTSLLFHRYRIEYKNLTCDFIAFTITVLSFLCIVGYLYNSTEFYRVKSSIPMAFPSAASFFLLSTALLLKRSSFGFFSLFTRKYIGSRIARFLMPFAIGVPIAGGIMQLYGEKWGLFSGGFGEAIFDTLNVLVLIILIWRCCIYLNKENKAVNQEIAKRKQAEAQAKMNEEFLNTLIEHLPEMIFLKDEALRFVRINKATERTVGLSKEELIGKTDYDFFPKEQADAFVSKDREAFESKNIIIVEEEGVGSGENLRWLHTKKIVIQGADGQQYLLGISQDITERKKMDEQLRQFNHELKRKVVERTRELKRKDQEKRALEKSLMEEKFSQQKKLMHATIEGQEKEKKQIGMELHDNINQILASTKLYIEMALSDEGLREQMLQKSRNQINHAISEIRTLSKSLVPHGIETEGLKEGILEIIETLQLSTTIHFITQIDDVIAESLDSKQQIAVYRIVQEQLNNIIKHAGAKTVTVQLTESDGMLELIVADDGRGFDVHSKRAGIGLSNIKSRIEVLNGKMEIISSIGKGCQLVVKFCTDAVVEYQ